MTAEQFPNSFVAAGVADTTLSASYTPGDGVLHVSSVPTGVGLTGAAFRVKVGGTIYRVTDLGSSPFLDWLIPAGPLEGTADASHGAGDDVFLDFTRGSLEDGIRSLDAITETDETANGWPNSVPKASTTFPPAAHATTHEPGGSDPMDVDAIAATGSLRTLGTGSTQAAAGDDSRLSDDRTPIAHAASHEAGGDPILIEQLGTAEVDPTLVLAPDGLGGAEWRAEVGGGGGAASHFEIVVTGAAGPVMVTTEDETNFVYAEVFD